MDISLEFQSVQMWTGTRVSVLLSIFLFHSLLDNCADFDWNYFWYLVKWNSYRSTSAVDLLSHLVHVSSGRMYNHTSCLILEVPGLIFMLSHGMLWEAAFPTVRSGNTLGTPNK